MLRKQKLYKNPDEFLYGEHFFAYISDLEARGALWELPQNLYVYYVLSTLTDEINNGGFAQYLSNSSRHMFADLLPCAELLNDPALTELIRSFTGMVQSWLVENHVDLEHAEYDDAFCQSLDSFDQRFYALDEDGLSKKILRYYKDNFTKRTISYEVVREQPSPQCGYFTLAQAERDGLDLLECLYAFLEEFDVSWELVFTKYRIHLLPSRDCFDLDELLAHFADPYYSFQIHGPCAQPSRRAELARLGYIQFSAPNPQDPTRPDYHSQDRLVVRPSGFAPGEYKIRRSFLMGYYRGSPFDDKVVCQLTLTTDMEPGEEEPVNRFPLWQKLLRNLCEKANDHLCIQSITRSSVFVEEGQSFTRRLYIREGTLSSVQALTCKVTLASPNGDGEATLRIVEEYSGELPKDEMEPEAVYARLQFDDEEYIGQGMDYLWMDALADLQRQLPQGTFLKCCLSCRYANQCPTGSLPNELYCTKDASIRKKQDLFPYTQGEEASRRLRQYGSLCPDYQAQSPDYFTYNDYPYLLGVGRIK